MKAILDKVLQTLTEIEKCAAAATAPCTGLYCGEDTRARLCENCIARKDAERLLATTNPAMARALRVAVEALTKCCDECGLGEAEFGNFTKLQLAARLGLIDIHSTQALAAIAKELGE